MLNKKYTPEGICRYIMIPFPNDFNTVFQLKNCNNCSNQNGSRFIFWTQNVLKGKIAEWIYDSIGGEGTQLQHYLRECTSDKWFSYLFDSWRLRPLIKNLEYEEKYKHLYAQAFLGKVLPEADMQRVEAFVLKFFLYPNEEKMPRTHYVRDAGQVLFFLSKQAGIKRPSLKQEFDSKTGRYTFSCQVDGQVFSAQSKSSIYARKRALRHSIDYLVGKLHNELAGREDYQAALKREQIKRFLAQKELREMKIRQWEEKQEQKKEERKARKEGLKQKAKALDKQRRMAKMKEKEKSEKQKKTQKSSLYRVYTDEEIATMSSSKRRRLEDLGVIKKRK